jgi:hypothetical protein
LVLSGVADQLAELETYLGLLGRPHPPSFPRIGCSHNATDLCSLRVRAALREAAERPSTKSWTVAMRLTPIICTWQDQAYRREKKSTDHFGSRFPFCKAWKTLIHHFRRRVAQASLRALRTTKVSFLRARRGFLLGDAPCGRATPRAGRPSLQARREFLLAESPTGVARALAPVVISSSC